jgi:hypothetical protein
VRLVGLVVGILGAVGLREEVEGGEESVGIVMLCDEDEDGLSLCYAVFAF